MKEFFDFLLRHWYLSGAFVVLLVMLTIVELRSRIGNRHSLDASKLTHLINRENPLILDLRDNEAFQSGHVVGAKQMSEKDVLDDVSKLQKEGRPVVLVDADGRQAHKIASQLLGNGASDIYMLAGGLAAWREAGMPLVKKGE